MKLVKIKISSSDQYKTLNDAKKYFKELDKGSTQILYANAKLRRDLSGGLNFLKKYAPELIPTKATLNKSHVLLGKIKSTDLDKIFIMLQGESWSPEGEARSLIKSKGLDHTSMSVGDVIVIGNKAYFVDNIGFEELD